MTTKGKFESYLVANSSTAHIQYEDNEILEEMSSYTEYSLPLVGVTNFGWLVYTRTPSEDMEERGFTDDFIAVLERARKEGYAYVWFDRDGADYDDMPEFDW